MVEVTGLLSDSNAPQLSGMAARAMSPPRCSVWEPVKDEMGGGSLAAPGDYEIGSGVACRLAGATGHPPDPTAIAHLLRRGAADIGSQDDQP